MINEVMAKQQQVMVDAFNQSQDLMKQNLSLWQDLTSQYTNLMVEGTQMVVNQNLAAWENMDQVLNDGIKQAQALSVKEQEMVLNGLNDWMVQSKASCEKFGQLMTPVAN